MSVYIIVPSINIQYNWWFTLILFFSTIGECLVTTGNGTQVKGKCTIRLIKIQNDLIHVTFQIRPPPNLSSSELLSYSL